KAEVASGGLVSLWPIVRERRPRIVVMAVREGLVAEIERVLGRKFDVLVNAGAPDALARVERACADFGEWTRIGLFGGASGAIEASVGSALHAAKIPFRS